VRLTVATSILELKADQAADDAAELEDLRLVASLRKGHGPAYEELIGRFQLPVYTRPGLPM
jgi:hypothetical protein